jgi:ubiquinol-cytochrome c reductase iron-sulfur subunit
LADILIYPRIKRRDFLYIATAAMGSVGSLAALWPFIEQMEPGADVLSAGAPISIDLSAVQPGQQIVVVWRSRPIFIVRRTPAVLAELKASSLLEQLRDPSSEELQQPPYATWSRSLNPEYLIVVGICTHLGCIPTFTPEPGASVPPGLADIFAIVMDRNTTWRAACSKACPHHTIFLSRPTCSPTRKRS